MIEDLSKKYVPGGIVTRLVGLTGLSASTINTIIPIAVAVAGFAGTGYMKVTAYNDGYKDATTDLEAGMLELDGKVVKIMTDADEAALAAYEAINTAIGDYEEISDETADRIDQQLQAHARRLYEIQYRENPVTDWGSQPVPDHVRMRFNELDRQRSTRGNPDTNGTVRDRSGSNGYPAPFPEAEGN